MPPKKIRFWIILILLLTSPWFWDFRHGLLSGFNSGILSSIFKTTAGDIQQINTRRSYYPNQLIGKIFENKPGFFLEKYKGNFFQGLDLNYYFFANHPRERAGVTEKEKIYWIWLPVFLIGLLWSLKKNFLLPSLVFLAILSFVSFFARIDNFNLFLVPFFLFYVYLGLKKLLLK